MTREERMGALGCMGRALVMHELAHGAGVPEAFGDVDAQKAIAVMMKCDAPPFHPCHPFAYSGDPSHHGCAALM